MLSRRAFSVGVAAAGLGLSGNSLASDSYPRRAIKIVVPFPPGTASEFFVRLIADGLQAKFGQPVIVENRPGGAGGTTGAATVANAAPDGYTLLASPPGPLVTANIIYKTIDYDPQGFVPVALLFASPHLLTINPLVPAQSMKELVDYAKSKPGKLSIASPGFGTQPHLLAEMFKSAAGIDVVHVPYKGPAAAITDLLAGEVQIYFETAAVVLPHAEAAKLRILAVATERRFAPLPDIPTTVESGFPNLVSGFWSGIVSPNGTPSRIVSKLNSAINEVMRSEKAQLGLSSLGGEAKFGSPEEFAAFIAAEREKWSAVIRAAGINTVL